MAEAVEGYRPFQKRPIAPTDKFFELGETARVREDAWRTQGFFAACFALRTQIIELTKVLKTPLAGNMARELWVKKASMQLLTNVQVRFCCAHGALRC
jgi:hypothetical protein